MTPEIAEDGLIKLPIVKQKKPIIWKLSDWPDLREMDIFK